MSGESFGRHDFAQALALVCADGCPGSQVGVVLARHDGEPAVSGGSTSHALALETIGQHLGEGAAADVIRTGVTPASRVIDDQRWESYAPAARQLGYGSVDTFALRHGGDVVGVVDIFGLQGAGAVPAEFLQPLAEIAAVHIVRESALRAANRRADQLEGALASRILIEQAKGMASERFGVPMESAFGSLRRHARCHNERLADLCASVANGDTDLSEIHVDYFAISTSRRTELRDRAIGRWRQANAEALAQRERALTIVSKSVELRVELEHKRALREMQMMGRAIDRHFRELSRSGQRVTSCLPCSSARQARRSDHSLSTRSRPRRAWPSRKNRVTPGCSGGSIVGQPDLVILGPDVVRALGEDLVAQLHRDRPDSRTLVVVEHQPDMPEFAGRADAVVVRGDARALVNRAWELCGVRARPERVPARADLERLSGDGS